MLTDDNIVVNYNNLSTVKSGRHCLNECGRTSGPYNVLSNLIFLVISVCVPNVRNKGLLQREPIV